MSKPDRSVRVRGDRFTNRVATKIWLEQPSVSNPFVAEKSYCHGYALDDLVKHIRYVDVLFLLFKGDLPTSEQSELLEKLMIAIVNPGPRHPATRAAQSAGVGKTDSAHILPIGLSVLGGQYQDALIIESAMRFFRSQQKLTVESVVEQLLLTDPALDNLPGFGRTFGSIDPQAQRLAAYLSTLQGASEALQFGQKFATRLADKGIGWLMAGIAAAVFSDLGLMPRNGAGLYQLLRAPGLLAHGLEMANKPITAMPFVGDDQYFIEE